MRIETLKLTSRPPFTHDFKLRDQTNDAIDSVCRNIAEGFGGSHADFARFLEYSRKSLNELQDCIRSAQLKGYVSGVEASAIYDLRRRLYPALNNFIAYLRRTDPRKRPRTDKHLPAPTRIPPYKGR